MSTLNSVAVQLKEHLKRQSPALLRLIGLRLLSKAQTKDLLCPSQVRFTPKVPIHLPQVTDLVDPQKELFAPETVQTDSDYVWDYANADGRAELLKCGSLRVGSQVPDTDFGNTAFLSDMFHTDRRPVHEHAVVMAPWSHYWGSYYDYLLFVAAKLVRMRAMMLPDEFAEAAVAYPLFKMPFESELLDLLGIDAANVFDTRQEAVQFDRCIVANNSSWFYPTAGDVLALKCIVEAQLPPVPSLSRKRLYISRMSRRKVVNEADLMAMLARYDFEFVEDKPRSVAEQVRLYQCADIVVGPHGASFANLLWCRPGTQLLELFAPHYRPEYFRYLAHVLGLRYAAYCHGPALESHFSHVDADIQVSVDNVEQGIVTLLG